MLHNPSRYYSLSEKLEVALIVGAGCGAETITEQCNIFFHSPAHIPLNMFNHPNETCEANAGFRAKCRVRLAWLIKRLLCRLTKTTQVRIFRFNVLTTFSWTSLSSSAVVIAQTSYLHHRPRHFETNLTLHLQSLPANVLVCNVTRWTTDTKLCRGGRSERVSKTTLL